MSQQSTSFTILILDNEADNIKKIQTFFSTYPYKTLSALDSKTCLSILKTTKIDLLIMELKMPDWDGIDVLKKSRLIEPDLKIIIQTDHGGIADAVEAIKLGASDFLEKRGSAKILRIRVGQIYATWKCSLKNLGMQSNILPFHFKKLIGEDHEVKRLKDRIVRVAPTDTTVLIQGESGTGKELVAQAIHHHSIRAKQPFMVVDCAAITATVIESELFGHTAGAFTGAHSASLGLIRSANKGTLFLDEIGELPIGIQAKFLRTLQERLVRPVGSTKNHSVDIRIIAATNSDLSAEVARGNFRQDLYYRINTVILTPPPLRGRHRDIELLTGYIIKKYCQKQGIMIRISLEAQQIINHYNWPGNVRELENILHSSMVFADGNELLPEDLPQNLTNNFSGRQSTIRAQEGSLAFYEQKAIKNALQETSNNRRKAAKILHIAEATLYRKIKIYNI